MDAKEAYKEYLKSSHWRWLRGEAIRFYGKKCSKCAATRNLQVHHHTYRHPWTTCTVKDVTPLCRGCHEKEHGLTGQKPVSKPRNIRTYQKPRKQHRKGGRRRRKRQGVNFRSIAPLAPKHMQPGYRKNEKEPQFRAARRELRQEGNAERATELLQVERFIQAQVGLNISSPSIFRMPAMMEVLRIAQNLAGSETQVDVIAEARSVYSMERKALQKERSRQPAYGLA